MLSLLSCGGGLGLCYFRERCQENLPVAVGFQEAGCVWN